MLFSPSSIFFNNCRWYFATCVCPSLTFNPLFINAPIGSLSKAELDAGTRRGIVEVQFWSSITRRRLPTFASIAGQVI